MVRRAWLAVLNQDGQRLAKLLVTRILQHAMHRDSNNRLEFRTVTTIFPCVFQHVWFGYDVVMFCRSQRPRGAHRDEGASCATKAHAPGAARRRRIRERAARGAARRGAGRLRVGMCGCACASIVFRVSRVFGHVRVRVYRLCAGAVLKHYVAIPLGQILVDVPNQ